MTTIITSIVVMFFTVCTNLVRAQQKDNKYFWLYSYVLVLLNSFGGGILAPIFLGQPSLLLSNNLLVPLSALAWYLTHQVPGMQAWFTSLPVKLVCIHIIYECMNTLFQLGLMCVISCSEHAVMHFS